MLYTFYEYTFFKIWICSSVGLEQWTVNPWVEGSNPSRSAKLSLLKIKFFEILVAEEEGYIYCIEEVIP